jgi:hypothetical protein
MEALSLVACATCPSPLRERVFSPSPSGEREMLGVSQARERAYD